MAYTSNKKSTQLDTLDNTTLANADLAIVGDVSDSGRAKGITFTSIKAFFKTYFDSLYPSGSGTSTGTNTGDQDLSSYATLTGSQTLSGKRITRRVNTVASSATPAINSDSTDLFTITALAAAITSFTTNLTGTPNNGDFLQIAITDNGTARAISWGASFESSTSALPTTTVISTRLDVGFVWNTATSKWRCVAVA